MAINNGQRLYGAFQLLSEGLRDVVDEVMTGAFGTSDWPAAWAARIVERKGGTPQILDKDDVQVQLRAISEEGYHFRNVLSRAQQAYASELREVRNKVMHGTSATAVGTDITARTLETMALLLEAVGSTDSAADIRKSRDDLQAQAFRDRTRKQAEREKVAIAITGEGLKPWREVLHPHDDVALGKFNASEFAADLHAVASGETSVPEYADPAEFFSRTYLTEGLRDLLTRALRRLSGDQNASPTINLQTNFGGGKTHSMLALHHLFGGTPAQAFPQEVQELVDDAGVSRIPRAHRVALVGTALQPGSASIKPDGTAVNTLWGELAWQLGGRSAYDMIADDDRNGTSPGAALRTLLERYSPALILVDEWVAYARQLVTDKQLPAGSFETQFSFAQALTEAVGAVPGAMLVISIPASETGEDGEGADVEVGGANGHAALARLQNIVRRKADQWRPSTRDESFEIVRRRLFQTADATAQHAIAATARGFANLYRANNALFPREAAAPNDDYEARIRSSYPLHPELLDRLYEDWSTLERFQRTRGVLKLVSTVVHELWRSNDTSPLIMPGTVPLQATAVATDLTQYLDDHWKPILDSDIAGPNATPAEIDASRPHLGERSITRRLARTIFLGAAPRKRHDHRGIDKQYAWLGTAIPGDRLGDFGQAVELLGQRSTYFYEDQGRYWFDTQPSVTKTANDYAERLREDPETVFNEIRRRLEKEQNQRGAFSRVHAAPESHADVPDLEDTRLVIVHPRLSYRKQEGSASAAHRAVREMLEHKGNTARTYRNALVFVVADGSLIEGVEQAARSYLAWQHVADAREQLGLTMQQIRQAEEAVKRHDQTVNDRVRDAYVWAFTAIQNDPTAPFDIVAQKVSDSGASSLAERVARKLRQAGELVDVLGPHILGSVLHEQLGTLWRERGEITVGELWSYFTRYPYLQRLERRDVLDAAILASTTAIGIDEESFAIAAGKDAATGRYRALTIPPAPNAAIQVTDQTLLVDLSRADKQRAEEVDAERQRIAPHTAPSTTVDFHPTPEHTTAPAAVPEVPRTTRFFGSKRIDPLRHARDLGVVGSEIIDRLAQDGVELEITIDIRARKATGFDESEIRTIRENARTLKFEPADFE